MKIFVTGGSGFLGQSLVRLLLNKGHTVLSLARSIESQRILKELGANIIEGNILNPKCFEDKILNCEAMFHLAGAPSFRVIDRYEMKRVHIEGTKNIIRIVEQKNISRFIYCSSVGAIARSIENKGIAYQSTYEYAKEIAHLEVVKFAKKRPGVIIALPAFVMGAGNKNILGIYIKGLCKGQVPFLIQLEQPMSYVHVDDVAEAMYQMLSKGKDQGQYILASDACTPLELANLVEKYSHRKKPSLILSPKMAKPFLFLDELLATFTGRHPYMTIELMNILRTKSWVFSGRTSQEDLGWAPRKLEQMVIETVATFA